MVKITIQIEKQYNNTLQYDISDFSLAKGANSKGVGTIGNLLLDYYHNKKMKVPSKLSGERSKLQFSLDDENEKRWMSISISYNKEGCDTQGLIYRAILGDYCSYNRAQREKILFHKNVELIEKAIATEKKIMIKYKEGHRYLNPIGIKISPDNRGTHLYCYCDEHKEYRNYRLHRLDVKMVTEDDIEYGDLEEKKEYDRNWSPYLNKKYNMIIELDEDGMENYRYKTSGRPQNIKEKGNVLMFESTIVESIIYFRAFLADMIRVEPKELRDKFEEMNRKIIERKGKLG